MHMLGVPRPSGRRLSISGSQVCCCGPTGDVDRLLHGAQQRGVENVTSFAEV